MKKIFITFLIFFWIINTSFANYKLENGSLELVEKYNFNTYNLGKEITRKEFLETLFAWYPDYKRSKGIAVNYDDYNILDNTKVFLDVDLKTDFWKKLSYFADKWIFAKNEYFNPNWKVNQKIFLIVMRRLKITFSLENCKYHRICEKEADENTLFLKWTYLKYVSKILNKNLRKYYSNPSDYVEAWYKPYLNSNYYFPILWQTLNGCYAFSVRNILKYRDWIWIYVSKAEKFVKKEKTDLWTYSTMNEFNQLAHIELWRFYNIDTLINSLQAWEPVSVSYMLEYYSWKDKTYKTVPHIVAAYSFDKDWVWVAETVKNKRVLVSWDELFKTNWSVALNRIFKYYYIPKSNWSEKDLVFENTNNILTREY